MLMPFEWAILTLEEAKLMKDYIEKSTSRKGLSVDYKKMQEVGMLDFHEKLRLFIERATHYEHTLAPFDPHEKVDRWELDKG